MGRNWLGGDKGPHLHRRGDTVYYKKTLVTHILKFKSKTVSELMLHCVRKLGKGVRQLPIVIACIFFFSRKYLNSMLKHVERERLNFI